MLVDSHTHLEAIDDLGGVLKRAQGGRVNTIITVGTSIATSKKAIEITNSYSSSGLKIYATCGIHPKDGKSEVEKHSLGRCIDTLKQLAKSSDKVVAIGECGLDYYLTKNRRQETGNKEKEFQRELFKAQIELARELKLPLVIHCRNGWEEISDLIRSEQGPTLQGVFHSWTGDWLAAQKALDLGFYLSFSGIITFKNAKEIVEVAKKAPLDRILIETDSPFLTPSPLRGELNEPKNVRIVAEFIANLRDLPVDQLARQTSENARRLFGI